MEMQNSQVPQQKIKQYPKFVAYHPSFLVSDGEKHVVIEADLNEWFDDQEVLQKLSELYGAKTAGELVSRMQEKPLLFSAPDVVRNAANNGIIGARVVVVDKEAVSGAPWWRSPPQMLVSLDRNRLKLNWDEPLEGGAAGGSDPKISQ